MSQGQALPYAWVPHTALWLCLRVLAKHVRKKLDTNHYLLPFGYSLYLLSCPLSEFFSWPVQYLVEYLAQFPCPKSSILSLNFKLGTEACEWPQWTDCLHLAILLPCCFRWLACPQTKPFQYFPFSCAMTDHLILTGKKKKKKKARSSAKVGSRKG